MTALPHAGELPDAGLIAGRVHERATMISHARRQVHPRDLCSGPGEQNGH
jgi:hypothetical protein